MIKKFTLVLGLVLLAVGVLAAMTGGHDHEFIIFGINTTHNAVHILSGLLGIVSALISFRAARAFCLLFGAVYGLVAIAGFASVPEAISLLNLNAADNFLHLGIAAACIFVGLRAKPV